jgi:hypothetical protein
MYHGIQSHELSVEVLDYLSALVMQFGEAELMLDGCQLKVRLEFLDILRQSQLYTSRSSFR